MTVKFRNSILGGEGKANYKIVGSLCEVVNARLREVAMQDYLEGDMHSQILIASEFTDRCQAELKRLKRGRPSAQLPFICCLKCFEDILGNIPSLNFAALEPALEEDDPEWDELDPEEFPEDESPELEDYLLSFAHADYVTAVSPVREDVRLRARYIVVLKELLVSAARLAKTFRLEEAARDLLEAYRRLQSCEDEHASNRERSITKEQGKQIFQFAERGWSGLWTGVQFAALKPLAVTKATRKRKA